MFDWGYHTEPEPEPQRPPHRGDARQGAGRLVVDQRDGLHARQPRRLRPLGAEGRARLVLRRRAALFQARRDLGGRRQRRGAAAPARSAPQYAKTPDPLFDAWLEAGKAAGISATPTTTTASTQEGFGRGQYTIRDGRRSSTARAYLRPARRRAQSHGRDRRACHARASCEGTRATGVEYVTGGAIASARRRARGDRVGRRVQFAAAPDAVGHRPGRASARDGHHAASPICRSARTCRTISAPT